MQLLMQFFYDLFFRDYNKLCISNMELSNKKMNQLLCFDLDNTLIDSSKTHILSYNAAFKKMNLPKKSAKEINSLLGMQKKEMIRILQPNIKNIKKIADLHS